MALGPNRSASMSSGLLLDPMSAQTSEQSTSGPRFRPYASPNHHVTKGRYITSNDPRGYIPVYEYPLNGQWIMLDMDDGYVLWTGIWKALGNNKADIVKIIDSQPELASQLRRVRGGYLKIQGTWMPYEIALRLARRVAWPIRHDLVPLFGPTFPTTCLSPDQPGYGQIVSPGTGKRRPRRSVASDGALDTRHAWTVVADAPDADAHAAAARAFHPQTVYAAAAHAQVDAPVMLHVPYIERARPAPEASAPHYAPRRGSPPSDGGGPGAMRYSPYPPSPALGRLAAPRERGITLPSLQPRAEDDGEGTTLPPISAMTRPAAGAHDDPMAILRRLQSDDDASSRTSSTERSAHSRRPSAPELLHHLPDASYGGGGRVSSARRPSAASMSPPLHAERLVQNRHSAAAVPSPPVKTSSGSQLPPSLARSLLMPPPPSPQAHAAPRDFADPRWPAEKPYCGAAADDRPSVVETRAWRPW